MRARRPARGVEDYFVVTIHLGKSRRSKVKMLTFETVPAVSVKTGAFSTEKSTLMQQERVNKKNTNKKTKATSIGEVGRQPSRQCGSKPGHRRSQPSSEQPASSQATTQPVPASKPASRQSATQCPSGEPTGKRDEASRATSKRKQKVKASELSFLHFLDMDHRLV